MILARKITISWAENGDFCWSLIIKMNYIDLSSWYRILYYLCKHVEWYSLDMRYRISGLHLDSVSMKNAAALLLAVGEDVHYACSVVIFQTKTHWSSPVTALYLLPVALSELLHWDDIVLCNVLKHMILVEIQRNMEIRVNN